MIHDIHNSGSQPDSRLKGLIKSRLLLILSHANSLVAADSDGVDRASCAELKHEKHLHPPFLHRFHNM